MGVSARKDTPTSANLSRPTSRRGLPWGDAPDDRARSGKIALEHGSSGLTRFRHHYIQDRARSAGGAFDGRGRMADWWGE
ncbi:hypothetical protein HNR20_005068 [Micromonospora parathelypteridis]|uniref:Uncharacterized protein n=1 Tax=Micromonospora parathelypteridis TaxID=1839617 RepID=A0A840VTG5_9ACTN|nr:hypothetical protein [Micromonospora parathelypteridis]